MWAKITAFFAALSGALYLWGKHQKNEKEIAEFEASTEKGNRELLEKEKTVLNKIEEDRKVWDEEQAESHLDNVVELEKLKNEDNDSVVVNSMLSMYNKDSNKDKAN
jgi:archaellum biogenesis ATPase FlaH